MNDEEMVSTEEAAPAAEESDRISPPLPESAEPTSDGEEAAAPAFPLDPDPHFDPAAAAPAPSAEGDTLEQLRSELTALRASLAAKEALLERIGIECEEFRSLYPETPLTALSDRVWEDVGRGLPIAAAYALAERRRALTEARAKASNHENSLRSAGAVESAENNYFSPDEVRKMTPEEVRTHYQTIMRSMQSWH